LKKKISSQQHEAWGSSEDDKMVEEKGKMKFSG